MIRTPVPSAYCTACTHRGTVRSRNEDSVLARPRLGLWAVADGAGGHGGGEVASAAVTEALESIPAGLSAAEILAQLRLRLSSVHASLQARSAAERRPRPMATTVVMMIMRGGHFAALWAGDSRAYLLRHGEMVRITRDHSLVQELVESGALTEEEAERHPQANVITRAIGAEGELELDKVTGRYADGDTFLLCSDGLFKAIEEPGIAARLRAGATAESLIADAVSHGARDNVTAVVIRIGDSTNASDDTLS
ncbi:PP2C family protein-serine/threonine phosphatase [Muricoccus radiodurans]|uniref:PP2C family protein-serine/threonine phosphatase n=1 Tax=Muricoccus radiodurans TaxID=2231721 RepID=UPI003CF44901